MLQISEIKTCSEVYSEQYEQANDHSPSAQAVKNQIPFRYVVADTRYASVENMRLIRIVLKKHFIMPLKSNRNVALSKRDHKRDRYVKIEDLVLEDPPPFQSGWRGFHSR